MPKLDLIPVKTEESSIADYVRDNEGITWEVKPDVKGHDTIGRGHKVKKGEDFSYLKNLSKQQKEAEFDRIFNEDIKERTQASKQLFPQFDNYPLDLKQALVDGVFRGDHKSTHTTVKEINKSNWKDVPKNYIDRDDYRDSQASVTSDKPWTGVYKRLDKNNKTFKKYAGVDTLKSQGEEKFLGYSDFDAEYKRYSKKYKINPNPDDPRHFYDYRKLYEEKGEIKPDKSGHLPSEYKLEGHPREILDGINTRTGEKVSSLIDKIIPKAYADTSSLDLQPAKTLDLTPVKLNLEPKDSTTLKLTPKALDLQPASPLRRNTEELNKAYLEKDKTKQMSLFGKVLDVLGRPGYAVKSAINERQDIGENILREMDMTKEDIKKLSPKERFEHSREFTKRWEKATLGKKGIKDTLSAAWKGLSGQERITANQIWERDGVKGVPFLGFATELAADPLMWFGGAGYKGITKGVGKTAKPILKVAKKGLGAGIRGLERVPRVGQVITTAKEAIPSLAEGLRKAFVTKSGIKGLTETIDKYLLKREYLKGKEIKYGVRVKNVIQNISKKTGQSIDDIEKQVVNAIEQPALGKDALPEIRALSNTLRTHFENLLTSEMKAGVPITHLAEGNRGIQYFPRITTKEAKQYLKQAKVGNAKIWNPKLANSLERKTGDFTLNEFNDFVKANGLESLGGKPVEQFFMKNPAYATAIRGVRSAKAVTSAEFLDDVGKTFGIKTGEAAKKGYSFYQELPDTITKLNPSLKGKVFDPEVHSEISKVIPKYFNPNELAPIVKIFDGIQNTWKRWTLAPFPKYHIRNMAGNLWNNYLADVNPKNYGKAQAIQTYRKYKTATKGVKGNLKDLAERELKGLGISTQQADDIIRQAEQTGVLGHGWFGGDIETTIEKTMQQGFKKLPLNTKIKKVVTGELGIEKGMAFGSTIENNARLAHFVDKIDKAGALKTGLNISDDIALNSAQSVKKYLFDYGDLTAFEKQIMKRLFPFYTWTRKNIPLQLETLWTKPQKIAPLGFPLRDREPKDLIKLKYARPDLYERLPIELRRDADTVTYVPLEGLVPAGDLAKVIRPDELLFEMITPYLKAPLELKFNKSLFFESEVQRYDKETQELLKMDLPLKVKYLATTILPQARLLNEINKMTYKKERKEELTPLEQAFSQSLSSIYKVSLKDLELKAKFGLKRKIDDLVRGAKWAKRKNREKEYLRIKDTIDETMEIFRSLR